MEPMLAAKLALEAEVAKPLTTACKAVLTDWHDNGGQVGFMSRMEHQQRFEAVLLRHYARVVMVVTGRTPDHHGDVQAAALSFGHAERLRQRAHNQALLIIVGIERELDKVRINLAEGKSADGEVIETKETIGGFTIRMATSLLDIVKGAAKNIMAKIPSIANVQTQGPAEEAQIEWVEQNKDADSTIFNVWSTMLDARVRDAHAEVEGQERRIDVPFDVGGYQLRYPGDNSLGAPLSLTINCRCSLKFVAVDAFGNRRDLNVPTPRSPTRSIQKPGQPLTGQGMTPTVQVPLNGRSASRIVLADGQTLANLRQVTPSTVVITSGRQQIARATFSNGNVTSIQIDPKFAGQGIEAMIRRSVAYSFNRGNR
jgi:hypothetical protein